MSKGKTQAREAVSIKLRNSKRKWQVAAHKPRPRTRIVAVLSLQLHFIKTISTHNLSLSVAYIAATFSKLKSSRNHSRFNTGYRCQASTCELATALSGHPVSWAQSQFAGSSVKPFRLTIRPFSHLSAQLSARILLYTRVLLIQGIMNSLYQIRSRVYIDHSLTGCVLGHRSKSFVTFLRH